MSNDSLDTSERPNVILIYTDQQRFDALSANGNERVGTPNLDAMASEGGGSASPTSPHRSVRRRGGGCSLRGTATPTRATRTTIRSRRRSRTPRCSYVKVGTGPRRSDAFDWRKTASHLAIHAPEDDWDRRVNESRSGRMQEPFADDTIPADRSITPGCSSGRTSTSITQQDVTSRSFSGSPFPTRTRAWTTRSMSRFRFDARRRPPTSRTSGSCSSSSTDSGAATPQTKTRCE